MVTCFNCGKNSYFATSYLELKDTGNIKEIEEEETSNKLANRWKTLYGSIYSILKWI